VVGRLAAERGMQFVCVQPSDAARFAHLTSREQNKLSTGQAHTALAATLLRHLHAVISTGQRWDPVIASGGPVAGLPTTAYTFGRFITRRPPMREAL
jgi:hypothetical protein